MTKKKPPVAPEQAELFAKTALPDAVASGAARTSPRTSPHSSTQASTRRSSSAAKATTEESKNVSGSVPAACDIPSNASAGLSTPLSTAFDTLPDEWRACLDAFITSATYTRLCAYVDGEREQGKTIYPATPFRALTLMRAADVKVVILGQDPYHGEDRGIPQAHGLAFSVPPGVRPPPSLRNICKEITAEFDYPPPTHGCLETWAQQGVLLLNTVLTVERDKAASHAKQGWEACTDALIRHLGASSDGLVFMLWGAHAQAKQALLADHRHHLVLTAPHPSPLSAHRGFLGCGHFAKANAFLESTGRTVIDWRIPPV